MDRYPTLYILISVVIIHSLGGFLESTKGSENWWIFNVLDSITHFSVPVFVMISGALLLKSNTPLFAFLKKRFTRILFPFLFWSIILFIGNVFLHRPMSNSSMIISFFQDLLSNNVNYVYWFVYMLIGLYLITPLLSKWIQNTKINEIEYFLLIWIVSLFIGMFPKFKIAIELSYFQGFIGYFILGYYLEIKDLSKIRIKKVSIALIIIGSLTTIFGNFFLHDVIMEAYLTPNIMLLSIGVFTLFKDCEYPNSLLLKNIILKLSKYSFGIYLIHVVFISILSKLGINCIFISPYIGTFIVSLFVITCSVFFLELFKRIPFTKYISGI